VILQTEWNTTNAPGDDDEHIEPVPRLGEVRLLADDSHRRHLHQHLHGEEDEDETWSEDRIMRHNTCGSLEARKLNRETEDGREGEDEVVEDLKNLAAQGDAHLVRTWLVQSERQAVQKYHTHAHSFKPRSDAGQGSTVVDNTQ